MIYLALTLAFAVVAVFAISMLWHYKNRMLDWMFGPVKPLSPAAGWLQCGDCGRWYHFDGVLAAAVAFHRDFDCDKAREVQR